MNKFIPIISAVVFAGAAPMLMAVDAHHPQTAPGAPASATTGMPGNMQEQMQKMQTQMGSIHQTGNAGERRKLLSQHMESMRSGMKMMREASAMGAAPPAGKPGMGTAPQSGQMMGGQMMGGDMQKMMGGGMMQRMDMMEMMMDQMMQHMDAMQAR